MSKEIEKNKLALFFGEVRNGKQHFTFQNFSCRYEDEREFCTILFQFCEKISIGYHCLIVLDEVEDISMFEPIDGIIYYKVKKCEVSNKTDFRCPIWRKDYRPSESCIYKYTVYLWLKNLNKGFINDIFDSVDGYQNDLQFFLLKGKKEEIPELDAILKKVEKEEYLGEIKCDFSEHCITEMDMNNEVFPSTKVISIIQAVGDAHGRKLCVFD